MQCENCGDQVALRHEREGIIHKNGRYTCRTRRNNQYTCASIGVQEEKILKALSTVKVPDEPKPGGRRKRDDEPSSR